MGELKLIAIDTSKHVFTLHGVDEQGRPVLRRLSLTAAALPGVPEMRNLLARLLLPPVSKATFILRWSRWRCRHQATAALCHY